MTFIELFNENLRPIARIPINLKIVVR